MPITSAVSATYGNFILGELRLERALWGVSLAEASAIDPQQLILLETSYIVFADTESKDCRARLLNTNIGVYLGITGFFAS